MNNYSNFAYAAYFEEMTNNSGIKSIDELIKKLSASSAEEFKKNAPKISLSAADVASFIYWNRDNYTRNCITKNSMFELLLLCWEPNQSTAIHDHKGSKCWVYMIDGLLKETIYKLNENKPVRISECLFSLNDLSYMDDTLGYHKLENCSDKRSISLHIYMKPIERCNYWNGENASFSKNLLTYYSCDGKILIKNI